MRMLHHVSNDKSTEIVHGRLGSHVDMPATMQAAHSVSVLDVAAMHEYIMSNFKGIGGFPGLHPILGTIWRLWIIQIKLNYGLNYG